MYSMEDFLINLSILLKPRLMKTTLLFTLVLLFISFFAHAQNSCDANDLQYLNENNDFVQGVAADCGADCVFASDPEGCLTSCMQAQTALSISCIGCFAEQVECATSNCFFECAFGSETACADCIATNCLEGFNQCAGIVDVDGDGFTTLSDCDDSNPDINPDAVEIWYDGIDQNCDGLNDFDQDMDGESSFEYGGTDCDDTDPNITGGATVYFADNDGDGFGDLFNTVTACALPDGFVLDNTDCDDSNASKYPEAPGTGENIDNNCDGNIDGEEVFICIVDLNSSGNVDVSDVLILLSGFGCSVNCEDDLNNDGSVNSADLLILLSAFGTPCN